MNDLLLTERIVRNSEFLAALFPNLPPDSCAWICAFPEDPNSAGRGQWAGFGLSSADFPKTDSFPTGGSRVNTFTTFSAFRKEGDIFPGRRNSLFAGMYALMLDDLGTGPGSKLPLEEHLEKLRPSWVLETSLQNHQVGYLFNGPIQDRELASAFIRSMIYQGLLAEEDPGMSGVARLGRLPQGWNTKAKYGPGGFRHRMLHWAPEQRYGPRQIAQAFGIDWDRGVEAKVASLGSGARARVAWKDADILPGERVWMELLARAVGRLEGPIDKGADGVWYDCTCPWVHEHTGMVDNGSAYCAGGGGGFECHHGHCRERGWREVRQWLLEHEDPEIARAAIGLAAQEDLGLELLEAPRRENFGEAIPVFQQARAAVLKLQKESAPSEIDAVLSQLGQWAVKGLLTRVEMSTLKKDLVDATGLGKGDLTEALKAAQADERRERNRTDAQKALGSRPGRNIPALPILPAGTLPWRIGDSETPALVSGNVDYLLRTAQVRVAFNEMRQRKEYSGPFRGWSLDWVASWLRDACTLNGLLGANEINLKRMTDRLAEECSYHPFQKWLDTLQWDGRSRLAELYATIKVAPDKEHLRNLIFRRWFCSAVAAARHLYADEPGLQPRGLVVFTGGQHTGKSTWFARLFSGLFPKSTQCFVGNAHYAGDKDSKMLNLRSLVVEWGELESTFSKTELGAIKAFVNQDVDSYRKPFGAEVSDIPRRSVFCATVNRPEFLRDNTGNSRFWTLPALAVDLDAQRRIDMAQVWAEFDRITMVEEAEARARGSYERPWLMARGEIEYVEKHNRGHRDRSDVEVWLQELFQWDDSRWQEASVEQRLSMNPMRLGDVASLVGINKRGYGHNLSELKAALRELTGQTGAINTTRTVGGRRVKAKFWGMPPLVDVPSDGGEGIFSEMSGPPH